MPNPAPQTSESAYFVRNSGRALLANLGQEDDPGVSFDPRAHEAPDLNAAPVPEGMRVHDDAA